MGWLSDGWMTSAAKDWMLDQPKLWPPSAPTPGVRRWWLVLAVKPLGLLVREGGGQSDTTVGRWAREDVHFVGPSASLGGRERQEQHTRPGQRESAWEIS